MGWPGEALIIKLWETLAQNGIGTLLTPWQTKRVGMAQIEVRRAEALVMAQVEADIADIRSGKRKLEDFSSQLQFAKAPLGVSADKSKIEPTLHYEKAVGIAIEQVFNDTVRASVNVTKSVMHAEEILKEDTTPPSGEDIGSDWIYRWRKYAEEVSSEDMQKLWGSLLAAEIKSPGAYSLRCMDFMRNLSAIEVDLICRVSKYVIAGIIWRETDYLESNGISFDDLLELQHLGLISGAESISFPYTWKNALPDGPIFISALTSYGKCLVVRHPDPQRELASDAFSLTILGRQVFSIGTFQPDMEYMILFGQSLAKEGFSVTLAEYEVLHDGNIRFYNEKQMPDTV